MAKRGPLSTKAYLLNQTGNADYDRLYIEHNSVLQAASEPCSLQEIVDNLPGEWEEFYINALSPASSLAKNLKVAPPYEVLISNRQTAPFVDLEAVRTNSGGHMALLQSNVRGQVKRANRLYEARGELKYEVAQSLPRALSIYDELITLHHEWWRKRQQPGAFHSEYFRIFHRRLIENRFATGEIQLIRVGCGGDTVGCLYNLAFRGVVYFYQSGLAIERDNRMKPAYVCHMEAIRHCARAGFRKYDFLAGVEGYKERLATGRSEIVWARVRKSATKTRVERLLRTAAAATAKAHAI
jgi:CelD/BcsL family acetyltransferase involved in cellulose biosynthesis